jgi:hypothetical protein
MAKQMERLYAHLDSIAVQRQAADVKRRGEEIRAAEASVNVRPVNVTGRIDPHMQAQVAEQIADRREALRAAEMLDGDERALTYCQDIIQQQPFTGELRNSDGSPLARGAYVQPFAPGMV